MSHTLGEHPILAGCKSSLAMLLLTARTDNDSITRNQDSQWCFFNGTLLQENLHKKRKTPGRNSPIVIVYFYDSVRRLGIIWLTTIIKESELQFR